MTTFKRALVTLLLLVGLSAATTGVASAAVPSPNTNQHGDPLGNLLKWIRFYEAGNDDRR